MGRVSSFGQLILCEVRYLRALAEVPGNDINIALIQLNYI